ncbi:Acetyltransferase (GNAT) family protein [Gemmobacter megaterium]|uniref:Acetyltransferase (GNAT) family protein n=1 Tax=Gemmobacter megaterium TaxID=1086013 RepID=A0A1N7M6D2_9RHOB|nr:GNAT family N-acetyltransferase [Gemmobacter megaterium]GGE08617.1 hypothetical protein GCM10011345_12850 [Gemmobacter megaterium]SIS81686.1 Acetyltransferase (GNAT) family protein [Gemmobacter megaterium]
MIRLAAPGDEAALTGFLSRHLETSMFLYGNLESQGLAASTHPHATRFVLDEQDGVVRAVLGLSNNGFLMCQAPQLAPVQARAMARLLGGRTAAGMTGDDAQVATFLEAVMPAPQLDTVEPLFTLDLCRLPPVAATIRPPDRSELALLTGWFAAYMQETQTGVTSGAAERARDAIQGGPVRLLLRDGQPVAMAGINAAAGDAVQVGGVYTPPQLRGQGFAGQVVAALLAERRRAGATRALLFAASDAAARAYLRIGFARIGRYRMALWRPPAVIGEAAG